MFGFGQIPAGSASQALATRNLIKSTPSCREASLSGIPLGSTPSPRPRTGGLQLGSWSQPRQDDQVDEGVDKQADRDCIRTDPDGPLSETLTGCNQE